MKKKLNKWDKIVMVIQLLKAAVVLIFNVAFLFREAWLLFFAFNVLVLAIQSLDISMELFLIRVGVKNE